MAARPLDTFLHRHLLGLLLALPCEDWPTWAARARDCANAPLAALLLEAAATDAQKAFAITASEPALLALASPFAKTTPLTILAEKSGGAKDWAEAFRQNINGHQKINCKAQTPFAELAIIQAREKMRETAGELARQHAQFTPHAPELEALQPREIYDQALAALAKADILAGQEMRHEASLCPIALLRHWNLQADVEIGRNQHLLHGTATAYGRGLSLTQARVSCIMEALERACAHARVRPGGSHGQINGAELVLASWEQLNGQGLAALNPCGIAHCPGVEKLALHWLEGEDATGKALLVPAQAAYLFCNLDETAIFEHIGSTGLAAGATVQAAKLAALVEALERDAQATMPFCPGQCFELTSRDQVIQGLLADYRWRGIHVQFQDITTEFGLPVYRCFVRGLDGSLAQACAAGLSGAKAALAALTETPWPYVWANPTPAPTDRGLANLPCKVLEDLPNYDLGDAAQNLALLERTLASCGYAPIYVRLTRPDLVFSVYRAFIPGLETDCELESGPSLRLFTNYQNKA